MISQKGINWLVIKAKFGPKVALITTGLIVGIMPTLVANSQLPPVVRPTETIERELTTVICQGTKTVVVKGMRSAVMINWQTFDFGPGYPPEKRCQIVSQKINRVVMANGGTLHGLIFRSGPLNGYVVICVPFGQERECNRNNMLFTLKPENRRNPGAIISQIMTFGQTGGAGTINESSGEEVNVNLSRWEDLAFPSNNVTPSPSFSPNPIKEDGF